MFVKDRNTPKARVLFFLLNVPLVIGQREEATLEKIVILSGITPHSSKLTRWNARESRDTRSKIATKAGLKHP